MERGQIISQLTTIFRNVFGEPTLILNDMMTANDVDRWDSLSHMLMISEVEKSFGIKFKLKDLNKMKAVGDLVGVIASKME